MALLVNECLSQKINQQQQEPRQEVEDRIQHGDWMITDGQRRRSKQCNYASHLSDTLSIFPLSL